MKNILYNLIINDNKNNIKLSKIYNSFYTSSEIYNNKFIELVD